MTDWTRDIRERLAHLSLRPEHEAEIVEELSQHLDDQVRERVLGGMASDDAKRQALADLDAPSVLAERLKACGVERSLALPPPGAPAHGRWLAQVWQDVRLVVRSLRRRPWFSVSVLATLALTIGPTTALVSVGNWLLWAPSRAIADPDRLVVIRTGTWLENGVSPSGLSYLNLDDIRTTTRTLSAMAGWDESPASLAVPGAAPRTAQAGFVTANFFEVLGVQLTAGRPFAAEEDRLPYGEPVAVVSHALAVQSFGTPEAALDKVIHLNGRPMMVVGVAPPSFMGASPTNQVDVWYPGAAYTYVNHYREASAARFLTRSSGLFDRFIGRLAPGRLAVEAQVELDTLVPLLADQHPGVNDKFKTARARVFPGLGPRELSRDTLTRQVNGLLIVAGILLLLGCANVSNLLLAEGVRAQRDRAVRLALGASRGRLVRQQLTEGVVLALFGAGLGLTLAIGFTQVIQLGLMPELAQVPEPPHVPMDRFVLWVTTGVAIACGILAALMPAWVGSRQSLGAAIAQGGGRSVTGAPRLRASLAAVQLALSLTLVTGAALMVVTLQQIGNVDVGFDTDGVATQWISLRGHGYSADRSQAYNRQLHARLEGDPAFEAVTLATGHPFAYSWLINVIRPGGDDTDSIMVRQVATDAHFTAVLGLRLLHGRYFDDSEIFGPAPQSGSPVVVSESTAHALFGRDNVVGERIRLANPSLELMVVGVLADTLTRSLTERPEPVLYRPLSGADLGLGSALLARSRVPLARVNEIVKAAAIELDPTLPLEPARSLQDWIGRGLSTTRLYARVLTMLGGIAVVLAAVGLYGLLSQAVGERRREFGVRMALGATARDIARLVLRNAAITGTLGVAGGLALTFWGAGLLEAYLWGVGTFDLRVYGIATAILLTVALLAALRPAWTATRVNPVDTLRAE
jgi:predicted permease